MEKKKSKKKINSSTFLLMITIALFAVMYIAGMIIFNDKGFAKPQMFMNLFISNAGLIVIGCGMTLVMITGGIDISVGSVTALVCMSAAYAMENKGMSAVAAVVISLLIGTLFGIVQGYLVTYLEIQPFIVTLAGMFFGRGLTAVISTDMIAIQNKTFLKWANYRINLPFGTYNRRGIFIPAYIYPTVIIALAVVILITIMLKFTKFGRSLYAIGGNLEAARLSGINVERTKLAVFAINGLMVAIAGLILSSRLGAGSPSAGNIAELDAIAACVIGGTSLAGGVGSVAGAVMGAFIMASLDNGMSMMDVPTFWQYIVKGAILLLAVWMDSATKRRS